MTCVKTLFFFEKKVGKSGGLWGKIRNFEADL